MTRFNIGGIIKFIFPDYPFKPKSWFKNWNCFEINIWIPFSEWSLEISRENRERKEVRNYIGLMYRRTCGHKTIYGKKY